MKEVNTRARGKPLTSLRCPDSGPPADPNQPGLEGKGLVQSSEVAPLTSAWCWDQRPACHPIDTSRRKGLMQITASP